MLKRNITYEDFNGATITETFYFNISASELVEMEVDVDGGYGEYLQRIVKAEDGKALIKEFKKLVLIAFGEKSVDGKRFVKTDESREEFSQTAAYQALFMELATDGDAAAEFVKAVLPANMRGESDKPDGPPPTPTSVTAAIAAAQAPQV